MNAQDAIITALTPGSPFNSKNKIWRSAKALAQFAQVGEGDLMDMLVGDLAATVACKPGKRGVLVALRELANNPPANQLGEQIVIHGGPAIGVAGHEGIQLPVADAPYLGVAENPQPGAGNVVQEEVEEVYAEPDDQGEEEEDED